MTQQKLENVAGRLSPLVKLAIAAVVVLVLIGATPPVCADNPAVVPTTKPKQSPSKTGSPVNKVIGKTTTQSPPGEAKLTVHTFFAYWAALDIVGLVLVVCLCSRSKHHSDDSEPETTELATEPR